MSAQPSSLAMPGRTAAAGLRFRGVAKHYGAQAVVKRLDLDVRPGEFMVLVGPSGCGKSTTLRMLAGLEDLSDGQIFIGDREVSQLPPAERGVAMVFQSYALYPHMTVAENMGFALKIAGQPRAQVDSAVQRAARSLKLEALLQRRPRELSGGQRQRVAIGRAIVRQPQVFLFDEPLSNLDAALRHEMRLELARLHQELGATIVYVTHDQVEAMTLGDRIAVFNEGRIEQVGTPLALYQQPANAFVAAFLGSPRINLLEARLESRPDGGVAWLGDCGHLALPAGLAAAGVAAGSGTARLGVRPEHWRVMDGPLANPANPTNAANAANPGLSGTVQVLEHLGDASIAYVALDGRPDAPVSVKLEARQGAVWQRDARVRLQVDPAQLLVFDAQGRRVAAP